MMKDIGYTVIELVVDLKIGCTGSVLADYADMVAVDQSPDSGVDSGSVYLAGCADTVIADQNSNCGCCIEEVVAPHQNIVSPVVQN